jgi:hypothetical protein
MFLTGGIVDKRAHLHFIVVTGPQIDHDVLVAGVGGNQFRSGNYHVGSHAPIEKHDGARIVQLIHLKYVGLAWHG